jgi:hypothetical protein
MRSGTFVLSVESQSIRALLELMLCSTTAIATPRTDLTSYVPETTREQMRVYMTASQNGRQSFLLDNTKFRSDADTTDLPVVQYAGPNPYKLKEGLRSGMPTSSWTITFPRFRPTRQAPRGVFVLTDRMPLYECPDDWKDLLSSLYASISLALAV